MGSGQSSSPPPTTTLPPPGLHGCRVIDSGLWPRYRYVEAAEPIAEGAVVAVSPAFAVTVTEEWRRRVCAHCFSVAEQRLETSCEQCDQVYYCNSDCRSQHASHRHVCPALRRFGALKKVGKETMAVMRLLLEVLANEHHQAAATPKAQLAQQAEGRRVPLLRVGTRAEQSPQGSSRAALA